MCHEFLRLLKEERRVETTGIQADWEKSTEVIKSSEKKRGKNFNNKSLHLGVGKYG